MTEHGTTDLGGAPALAGSTQATTTTLPADLAYLRCATVNVVFYGAPGAP